MHGRLPSLESLVSPHVLASGGPRVRVPRRQRRAACPCGWPLRLLPPNGRQPAVLVAQGNGKDFELNRTMKPLEPLKGKIQVLGGLDNLSANAGKDGGGDHAGLQHLSHRRPHQKRHRAADIRAGTSIDQLASAADRPSHPLSLPSSSHATASRKSGSMRHRSYSYASPSWNMSCCTPTTPMAPEPNPRMVFDAVSSVAVPPVNAQKISLKAPGEAKVDPGRCV